MSKVRSCDRCGKIYSIGAYMKPNTWVKDFPISMTYYETIVGGKWKDDREYMDLCPECSDGLRDFLRMKNTDHNEEA